MGRAGGGGGRAGGSRSSGGGRSSSRSGGGHRVGGGGGSRARGGGSSFGGSRGGFGGSHGGYHGGPGMPHHHHPHHHHHHHGHYHRPYHNRTVVYRNGSSSVLSTILAWIIVLIVVLAAVFHYFRMTPGMVFGMFTGQKSTIERTKLDTNNAYMNDCIIDEIGWFDNTSKTSSKLKEFWEETGVQPYIILKDYDASLTSDSAKEQWTLDYYDTNFEAENIFLYVYFAEEDVDNDVGYMCYANGLQTSSVMDAEAVDIFWNNIDRYWYTDLSTDELFIKAFNGTASTIMRVSTTGKDIVKWVLIIAVVSIAGKIVISVITKRNKRAKEEAEEQQRILNTPLEQMVGDSLTEKYIGSDTTNKE